MSLLVVAHSGCLAALALLLAISLPHSAVAPDPPCTKTQFYCNDGSYLYYATSFSNPVCIRNGESARAWNSGVAANTRQVGCLALT